MGEAIVKQIPGGLLVLEETRQNVHVRTPQTMDGTPAVAVSIDDFGAVTFTGRGDASRFNVKAQPAARYPSGPIPPGPGGVFVKVMRWKRSKKNWFAGFAC